MPSASAKLEKQASIEAQDPIKQVLSVIEKKVRNLEKRKGKLDTYKYEFSQGKELNEDQKNAIKKYDEVIQSLEFAKDLQKQFISISQESVKVQKKQAKREQAERQVQEVQRTRELLVVQDVLNNMGLEHVRNCFLTGVQGALSLTEENLNQLDDLYKLISITRDSEEASSLPIEEQLIAAADHLVALLDGKNKEVLGTTYKDLKDLIFKIHECGFLNSQYALQKELANGEEELAENDAKDYGDEPEEDYTVLDQAIHPHTIAPLPPIFQPIFEASEIAEKLRVKEDAKDYGDEPEEDYMELDQAVVASEIQVSSSTPVASGMETQSIPQQVSVVNQQPLPPSSQQPPSQQLQPPPTQTTPTPAVPPTSTVETFFSNYRPINEGNFNFLQESQIDLESPHMDPAVVAAHPMAPPPMLNCASQHSAFQEDPNVQRGQSPRPMSPTQVQQSGQQPVQSQAPQPLLQQQLPLGQPDYTQRIQTQTFTNQNFVGIQSMAAGGAPNFPSQTIYTLSQIEQPLQPLPHPVNIGQTTSPSGSPPPQDLSLALGSQPGVAQGVEPKKHFMNVNAVAFESSYKQTSQVMSSSQNLDPSAPSLPSSNFGSQSQPSQVLPADIHGSDSTPGSYPHQSGQSNFQSCGRGSSGNFNSVSRGVRGGGSGRGGRGGGGSANGFNNRGGGGGNNGNYNNGRGNFQSYRENPGNYYQNNFQRDNYNSGGQANFNNGYKRGGGGLGNGGGNRGSNTMRGGVSRGSSMRGGNMRGGSRGGYTKSNQAQ